MIKSLLIAGFLAGIFFSVSSKHPALPVSGKENFFIARGPIAFYPMDGDAKDHSGHNKHGKLMNGTTFSTDAHGNQNGAAYFDGKDDYILVKDASNYFAPRVLSVSFLINLRDVSARSALFVKSAFDEPKALTWGSFVTDNIAFRVTTPKADCDDLWYDNTRDDLYSKKELKNNRWYAITIVFTRFMKLIYIDGKMNTYTLNTYPYLKQCSAADFRIGGWWKDDIISIHGKLDNIRIYDRVLMEEEIKRFAAEAR